MPRLIQDPGRAIDYKVAVEIMGWTMQVMEDTGEVCYTPPTNHPTPNRAHWVGHRSELPDPMPRWATSRDAVHDVEVEIEQRGLRKEYILLLMALADFPLEGDEMEGMWAILHELSPAVRCRAALETVKQAKRKEPHEPDV